jgi:hypothetical protein
MIPVTNDKKLLLVIAIPVSLPHTVADWLMNHKSTIKTITSLKLGVRMIPGFIIS